MRRPTLLALVAALLGFVPPVTAAEDDWISLFDGQTLTGWTASENRATFSVRDGMIVVDGARSHLFYTGEVEGADFENFEWKAEVKTEPGANSGMYFHTAYREEGWPDKGYEAQVNNSHTDPRRTGSLYGIVDVHEVQVSDGEWFTQHIVVTGKRIVIKVNGTTTVDYTEPPDLDRPERQLSSGTLALQGHDPESVIYYRNILVKPLPD